MSEEHCTRLHCSECGKSTSSPFIPLGHDFVQRCYVLCPECLEFVPNNIASRFFLAIKKGLKKQKKENK